MRRPTQAVLGAAALACVTTTAGSAAGDPSGWVQFGSGATAWQLGAGDELKLSPSLCIDAGMGSSSDGQFIFGGLFRLQPFVGYGTDVSWVARAATHGFQSEWFGFAIDAGPYVRGWGEGSAGIVGQGILGGPLGLQLAAQGHYGSNEAAGFGVTLGVDFARLTVHRKHLFDWWPNPRPVETLDDRARAAR